MYRSAYAAGAPIAASTKAGEKQSRDSVAATAVPLSPRSRRQPPHHLHRAALVDGQAHQLALRIEHHPVAILLADGVAGLRLRGGRGAVLLSESTPACG